MPTRRHCILAAAGAGLQALVPVRAAPASQETPAPLPRLKIYIPAGVGGGWDQTGRGLGNALALGGLAKELDYENRGGKGGTLGLADFAARHGRDPQALFVGGMVLIGALATNPGAASLSQLAPVARLTSDHLVLGTATGGRLRTAADLSAALRRNAAEVVFAGGSAGGVDHMLAAMVLRALRLDPAALKYLPTSSGKEALALLAAGQAQVVISGHSEVRAALQAGALQPLAVSAKKSMFGIASLREQGIETDLSNWRAVFASAALPSGELEALRRLVRRAVETPHWQQTLAEQNWAASPLYGADLERFLAMEQEVAALVTGMLKLRSPA